MIDPPRQKPTFRFAPSPNGPLHLGHALSAILNHDMAKDAGGRFLLRIEDIDLARCTPELEAAVLSDLDWLGLDWERPVRRQSEHFDKYQSALSTLIGRGLVYPAFMTRGEVRQRVREAQQSGLPWPRDPDGAPHYPADDRDRSDAERRRRIDAGEKHAWRLDMAKALAAVPQTLSWMESGDGRRGEIAAEPGAWGDVVLSRSDAPSSYHLSVVVDDAAQGITHVVRGLDLFAATATHRLLQALLDLPQPLYHHHRLITDPDGRKLSKSFGAVGLAALREEGLSPADIRRRIGL
ncbi:tRNA glutamyl-Q(34) synthetase GluQRS [Rhizobium tumorigenes]|uniref:tRNA glutamyl-Q(34) synthetase GluQRS n=1 Tax=Rhizobium tumorigenes TaxID=2041385 RepID=UPI00241EFC9B|nr:tRNA glutamyl-Q(34) synthetase GluQRS [Rhizobium tumorigenes]WFS00358.1 tRNA glutamyl-Q(34) synthetase GluQRS [Rhizobium tumorigenes]